MRIGDGVDVELRHCPFAADWSFERHCLAAYHSAKAGSPLWSTRAEPCWARQARNVLAGIEAEILESKVKDMKERGA